MSAVNLSNRRHFTQAAREAALLARQARSLNALPIETPEVFVTRCSAVPMQFGWEIRRFGGIVLSRSDVGFDSMEAARAVAQSVLQAIVSQ